MDERPRHIPNEFPTLQHLNADPDSLLLSSLQRILNTSPPQSTYTKSQLGGLFNGHTGIAYLFLHVSTALPSLQIHGYPAIHWANAYISGGRGPHTQAQSQAQAQAQALSQSKALEPGNCGLACEPLCHPAVRACITKDLDYVREFLALLPHILAPPPPPSPQPSPDEGDPDTTETRDPFPSDLLHGRSGALYLLRLIRHWVPNSAPLVENSVVRLTERILATNDDGHGNWLWHGRRYLGPAHGDAGILTQLVLTTPPLAHRLLPRVEKLLDLQQDDGNWPAAEPSPTPPGADPAPAKKPKKELVQWCHGAPGIVLSLLSLRPFYPTLRARFDAAIEKGTALTWEHGLLRKEPSLCHGIFGNSLILPLGSQREHFLALATPEVINDARRADPEGGIFKPAAYGKQASPLLNYDPSSAWAWLVCRRQTPRMILYNDI